MFYVKWGFEMITIALALLKRFWPYILAALLVIAAVAAWNGYISHVESRGDKKGYDRATAEYNVKLVAAEEAARLKESAWKDQIKGAQDEAAQLRKDKVAAAAANSVVVGRLRNQLTNLSNGLSTASITACRARAATLADVFGQCTERLVEMGKAADGQYIDAVSCRGEWPK